MLGGLDWAGLPIVVELLGVTDVEGFILRLIAIRDWLKQQDREQREKTEE